MTSQIQARRLNDKGLEILWDHIGQCLSSQNAEISKDPLPKTLLTSDELSEQMKSAFTLDLERQFPNRFEFAKYFVNQVGANWSDGLDQDIGFWSWVAIAYWSQFTSKSVRRQEHYIPAMGPFSNRLSHGRIDYRHCARTPCLLFKRLGDQSKLFLAGSAKRPRGMAEMGDFIEQILSRQDVFGSDRLLEVLRELYADENGLEKTGSTADAKKKKLKNGKWSQSGRGGARRLVTGVLPRLKLTYNIGELGAPEIVSLAGPEFQNVD